MTAFLKWIFSMLGSMGKISDEDYADFKRLFHRKIFRFMELLKDEVTSSLNFKNFDTYTAKVNSPELRHFQWNIFLRR